MKINHNFNHNLSLILKKLFLKEKYLKEEYPEKEYHEEEYIILDDTLDDIDASAIFPNFQNITLLNSENTIILDGYITNTRSQSFNETSKKYDNEVQQLTGFSGSNGYLLILVDSIFLFTDSRYLIQAKKEVSSEIKIIDLNESVPTKIDFIKDSLEEKMLKIGYNASFFTKNTLKHQSRIFEKYAIKAKMLPILKRIKIDPEISINEQRKEKTNEQRNKQNIFSKEKNLTEEKKEKREKAIFKFLFLEKKYVKYDTETKIQQIIEESLLQHKVKHKDKDSKEEKKEGKLKEKGEEKNLKENEKDKREEKGIEEREERGEKKERREEKISEQSDFILIINPESICWLLNLRCLQLDTREQYTPTIHGYLLLSKIKERKSIFFTRYNLSLIEDSELFTQKMRQYNIEIIPFSEIEHHLCTLLSQGHIIESEYGNIPISLYIAIKKYSQIKKYSSNPLDLNNLVTSNNSLHLNNSLPSSNLPHLNNSLSFSNSPHSGNSVHSNNSPHSSKLLDRSDHCLKLKATKNENEIHAIEKAHIKDGIAWCKFLKFLSEKIANSEDTNEFELTESFLGYRKLDESFECLSFKTISSYGKNGAIVHYSPKSYDDTITFQTGYKNSDPYPIYLIDSGGQYKYGTTDATRVVLTRKRFHEKNQLQDRFHEKNQHHEKDDSVLKRFKKTEEEYKKVYTTLLKSHIHLASAKFPKHASGAQLDSIARYHLWQILTDYGHSTGHGVGHFLSVHEEGHYGISGGNQKQLEVGMILSIEPGVYFEGKYGMRIENLYKVCEVVENKQFLHFKALTLIPINIDLIDFSQMTAEEIVWLESYHKEIFEKLSRYLEREEREFLRKICQFGDFKIE